jgi:Domain of unknown function (DUF222)
LPEGLAQMAPGPELAQVLASVDADELSDAERHVLAAVWARQVAHDQAGLLSAMLAAAGPSGVGAGDPLTGGRNGEPDEFRGDQLAFTLRWSRTAVSVHLDVAEELAARLPMVYASLLAGRIDLAKARAFVEALSPLSLPVAQAVAVRLLPRAERYYTVGQLRERLRYHVYRADPELAGRRVRHSVAQRRVYQQLDAYGTATLAGVCLPPDRAAAAADRVERLARAARADGDARNLDQLRADAMLALLSGAPFTLRPPVVAHTAGADAELAEELAQMQAAWPRSAAPDVDAKPDLSAEPDRTEPVAVWAGPEPHTPDPGDGYQFSEAVFSIGAAGMGREPVAARTADGKVDLDRTPTPDRPDLCVCGGVQPAPRSGTVELLVRLDTLMGLNEHPGQLAGWGLLWPTLPGRSPSTPGPPRGGRTRSPTGRVTCFITATPVGGQQRWRASSCGPVTAPAGHQGARARPGDATSITALGQAQSLADALERWGQLVSVGWVGGLGHRSRARGRLHCGQFGVSPVQLATLPPDRAGQSPAGVGQHRGGVGNSGDSPRTSPGQHHLPQRRLKFARDQPPGTPHHDPARGSDPAGRSTIYHADQRRSTSSRRSS